MVNIAILNNTYPNIIYHKTLVFLSQITTNLFKFYPFTSIFLVDLICNAVNLPMPFPSKDCWVAIAIQGNV